MKTYEAVTKLRLVRRTPVIVRVDGKAFHTLTAGMDKPYDADFTACMEHAAVTLCSEIQNAKLAYHQSDEISVLMVDYDQLDTQAWFDDQVQKIVSVAASVATSAFTGKFRSLFPAKSHDPLFDARAFNVPADDVNNYFVWRQQDAVRNSIHGLGQAHFSASELHGVNCDGIQEMLFSKRGVNWNDVEARFKRGSVALKSGRSWFVDAAPTFTKSPEFVRNMVFPAISG